MQVLIACESSGIVRDAFIRGGHVAMSCDFLPSKTPGPHYQGDVREILCWPWDLLIAHPPCTFLSVSGIHWNRNPKSYRYGGRQTGEALAFARLFIDGPETAHIPGRVVENPISIISTHVRKPDQIIQPYEFGADASKATCLWLHGVPKLEIDPAKFVPPRSVCPRCGDCQKPPRAAEVFAHGCARCGEEAGKMRPRWANQTNSGQNRLSPSPDRWQLRSETYPGIAQAFADQWGAAQ